MLERNFSLWGAVHRCAPDIPEPPDPRETSAAQTGTSVSTALANAFLRNTGRVGPEGSTRFEQTGTYEFTEPYTGETYQIPTFTEYVELSPEQQAIYDQQQGAKLGLAELANQQADFLQGYMSEPIDLSNEVVEARLYELGSRRLDPRFERQREDLQTRLLNRGIREGTEAWDAAMDNFNQSQNDAYTDLLLEGRGQAVQEALAERSQPINEIASLLGGSQINIPQFSGHQQPTIPTTDTAGLIGQNYQQRVNKAMAEYQAGQGLLGGLFGLGSAALMGL